MTRCDTCGENLDRMEAQSVQTQNGDFCLICAAREIDRLHKLEESVRWRKWPEEAPEKTGYYTIYCKPLEYPVACFFSVRDGWEINYKRFWWIKLEIPKN